MYQAAKALDHWMSNGGELWLLAASLTALVFAPAFVLVHELGHAVVGLALTEGIVRVEVGRQPAPWRARIGRLHLSISPLPARNAPAGLARVYLRYGVGFRTLLSVAGPLAQAGAGALLVLAGRRWGPVFDLVGAMVILEAVANLVPWKRDGYRSDGMLVVDAFRNRALHRPPPPHDLEALLLEIGIRWEAHFTAFACNVDERERPLFLAARGVVGDDGEQFDVSESRAVTALALAGWSWRAVERGSTDKIRGAALDALHSARLTGAVEPMLTVLAAHRLVVGTDLSVASPGFDDVSRRRLLDGAFDQLSPKLRPSRPREEAQREAFLYGVALHDVRQFGT